MADEDAASGLFHSLAVQRERERAIDAETALRELFEEKLRSRDEALRRQAGEYERRLEELNHAARLTREHDADYLLRESYEQAHNALTAKIEEIARELGARMQTHIDSSDDRFKKIELQTNRWGGGMAGLLAAIGITTSLILLALALKGVI